MNSFATYSASRHAAPPHMARPVCVEFEKAESLGSVARNAVFVVECRCGGGRCKAGARRFMKLTKSQEQAVIHMYSNSLRSAWSRRDVPLKTLKSLQSKGIVKWSYMEKREDKHREYDYLYQLTYEGMEIGLALVAK